LDHGTPTTRDIFREWLDLTEMADLTDRASMPNI